MSQNNSAYAFPLQVPLNASSEQPASLSASNLTNSEGFTLEQLRDRARNHVKEVRREARMMKGIKTFNVNVHFLGMICLKSLHITHILSLFQAMKTMDHEKKAAFEEAMEKCPELVEKESDPLKYIRSCQYNVWEAAEKLAYYWSERKDIFQDRAFLPLDLSGEGAFQRNDILLIQAGADALLPKLRNGKQVMFGDRRQLVPSLSDAITRMKSIFYTAHLINQDENAATEGLYCVVLLVTSKIEKVDNKYLKRVYRFANKGCPFPVKWIYLNSPAKTGKQDYNSQELIASYLQTINLHFSQFDVFIEREDGDLLRDLCELGCTPEGVPKSVGGSWNYVEWSTFCQQQMLKDREQLRQNPRRNKSVAAKPRRIRLPPAGSGEMDEAEANRIREERKARKREANLVHSRRKRERRKLENQALQQEHDRLQKENTRLKKEKETLKRLRREAKEIVANEEKRIERNEAAAPRYPAASLSISAGTAGAIRGHDRPLPQEAPGTTSAMSSQTSGEPSAGTGGNDQTFAQVASHLLNRSPEEQRQLLALLLAQHQQNLLNNNISNHA